MPAVRFSHASLNIICQHVFTVSVCLHILQLVYIMNQHVIVDRIICHAIRFPAAENSAALAAPCCHCTAAVIAESIVSLTVTYVQHRCFFYLIPNIDRTVAFQHIICPVTASHSSTIIFSDLVSAAQSDISTFHRQLIRPDRPQIDDIGSDRALIQYRRAIKSDDIVLIHSRS